MHAALNRAKNAVTFTEQILLHAPSIRESFVVPTGKGGALAVAWGNGAYLSGTQVRYQPASTTAAQVNITTGPLKDLQRTIDVPQSRHEAGLAALQTAAQAETSPLIDTVHLNAGIPLPDIRLQGAFDFMQGNDHPRVMLFAINGSFDSYSAYARTLADIASVPLPDPVLDFDHRFFGRVTGLGHGILPFSRRWQRIGIDYGTRRNTYDLAERIGLPSFPRILFPGNHGFTAEYHVNEMRRRMDRWLQDFSRTELYAAGEQLQPGWVTKHLTAQLYRPLRNIVADCNSAGELTERERVRSLSRFSPEGLGTYYSLDVDGSRGLYWLSIADGAPRAQYNLPEEIALYELTELPSAALVVMHTARNPKTGAHEYLLLDRAEQLPALATTRTAFIDSCVQRDPHRLFESLVESDESGHEHYLRGFYQMLLETELLSFEQFAQKGHYAPDGFYIVPGTAPRTMQVISKTAYDSLRARIATLRAEDPHLQQLTYKSHSGSSTYEHAVLQLHTR